METGIIEGYIDEDINFCPYCGEKLESVNLYAQTICKRCNKTFFVINGEKINKDKIKTTSKIFKAI